MPMHWILQLGLDNNPANEDAILEAVRDRRLPHTCVKLVPFSHELIPEPQVAGKAVIYGGIGLKDVAATRSWSPGMYINENFEFPAWRQGWPGELLNQDAQVSRFADVQKLWPEFFIRPCHTDKSFTGSVVTWDQYQEWRDDIAQGKSAHNYHGLTVDTPVMYGPAQPILRECRFFVVNGRIVDASFYRISGQSVGRIPFYGTPWCSKTMEWYCLDRVGQWTPHRAFVIDIAETAPLVHRVVEVNCINSSGLYCCDAGKIVDALEAMES